MNEAEEIEVTVTRKLPIAPRRSITACIITDDEYSCITNSTADAVPSKRVLSSLDTSLNLNRGTRSQHEKVAGHSGTSEYVYENEEKFSRL
jgi:hypothetical protein